MKKFFVSTLILCVIFLSGCNAESNQVEQSTTVEKNSNAVEVETLQIKISVGEKIFNATLEDNDSSRAFIKKLPIEITMNELNGNEKYYNFAENFPSNDKKIGEIHAGDLMLYSSSYVVLFYKNFSTSYSYTRLGKIDNPSGLSDALGTGNISVKFEKNL